MDNIFEDDLERLAGRDGVEVKTETSEEEDTYLMMMGLEFETAGELVNFYNQNLKEYTERPDMVYGSGEDVKQRTAEGDSWAAFRPQKESVRFGDWGVDTMETIDRFLDVGEAKSVYEETAKTLAAATLYTVSRAESDGKVGTGMFDFHRDMITLPSEEPIEIEITQKMEADYDDILAGTVDDVRGRVESIEDPDYNRLIEEEEKRKDRITLKRYLRERQESEDETI